MRFTSLPLTDVEVDWHSLPVLAFLFTALFVQGCGGVTSTSGGSPIDNPILELAADDKDTSIEVHHSFAFVFSTKDAQKLKMASNPNENDTIQRFLAIGRRCLEAEYFSANNRFAFSTIVSREFAGLRYVTTVARSGWCKPDLSRADSTRFDPKRDLIECIKGRRDDSNYRYSFVAFLGAYTGGQLDSTTVNIPLVVNVHLQEIDTGRSISSSELAYDKVEIFHAELVQALMDAYYSELTALGVRLTVKVIR